MHEAISDLATLRARLGDYARAETLQRRALALAVDLIGPRSDQAATDVNNLAVTVITEGRLDAGLDLLHDAYDRYVEMVGPLHWRTANAARNVGVVMTLLERYGDARMWLERAVRGSEAAEGAGGQTTTYIRAQLANTMVFAGERQAGLEMLAACVNRLRELDPEESHYSLADARLYFARALLASGRPQEAEAALRAVRAFRDRVLPAGHRQRFEAACELGRAVAAQHRAAEARTLLEGCVTQIKDNPLVPRTVREATVTLLDTLQISR